MNKFRLIVAREYMALVGRKSFIVMTILVPIVMILVMAVPIGMAYLNEHSGEAEQVAVIDETGRYGAALHSDHNYTYVTMQGHGERDARSLYENTRATTAAVVLIPAGVDSLEQVTIYSEDAIEPALVNAVSAALRDTLEQTRINAIGVPGLQQKLDDARVHLNVRSVKWDADGQAQETSTDVAMVLGWVLTFFLFFFMMTYGAMIMSDVIEEKTNRIIEVVVSSCKPFQLMMGKIVGVGLVGITQMLIWAVILSVVMVVLGMMVGGAALASGVAAQPDVMTAAGNSMLSGETADIVRQVTQVHYGPILLTFLLYFVGGYLLYGSLYAGFASGASDANDASQFTTPIVLFMLVAFYAAIACAENPNGPLAVWCSIIPFTSPVVMMVRIPFDVPLWQLVLSVALLYATALGMIWMASRIYRRGILLYGKKVKFTEMMRWLKG